MLLRVGGFSFKRAESDAEIERRTVFAGSNGEESKQANPKS